MTLKIALTVHALQQFYMRKMGGETLTEEEFVGRKINNRQYLDFLLEAYVEFFKRAAEKDRIFVDKEGSVYIDDRESRLLIILDTTTQKDKEELGKNVQYVNVTISPMKKFRKKVGEMVRIHGAVFKNATLVFPGKGKRPERSIKL